uniref:hypothetical protein n=1 Tax=Mycolicibacterium iranicum TaxID=912594 RepID=UPI003F589A36
MATPTDDSQIREQSGSTHALDDSRIRDQSTPESAVKIIWAASGVALTALCAALLFGHTLSGTSVGGIALIVVGVVLVEWGAQAGHRRIGQEL